MVYAPWRSYTFALLLLQCALLYIFFFWSFSMSYSFLLPEHMTSHMKVTTHLVLDFFFSVCLCGFFFFKLGWIGVAFVRPCERCHLHNFAHLLVCRD